MKETAILTFVVGTMLASGATFAAGPVNIEMKNGRFNPASIMVPVDQKVELLVKNNEKSEVEFESFELNREVKIKPGETSSIFVGPLNAGTFPIFDDNNPDAKGAVIAQ